jgi:hypothetical protein
MVNIKKTYNFPILLDEQGLRRIYNEISNSFTSSTTSFVISYSDKSSITDSTIDDVVNDENKRGRKIRVLRILCKSKHDDSFIDLCFGGYKKTISSGNEVEKYIHDVSLEISSIDRQSAFIIQSLLEDRLKSFKVYYVRPTTVYIISLIICAILITIFLTSSNFLSNYFQPDIDGEKFTLLRVSIVLLIVSIPVLGSFVLSILFPSLTFAIGAQIEYYKKLTKWKSNIFWVIIIGLLLMFAQFLIAKLFFK